MRLWLAALVLVVTIWQCVVARPPDHAASAIPPAAASGRGLGHDRHKRDAHGHDIPPVAEGRRKLGRHKRDVVVKRKKRSTCDTQAGMTMKKNCPPSFIALNPHHSYCLAPAERGGQQIASSAYTLPPEEQQQVINAHNKYRAEVTPKAETMYKLAWDQGLADTVLGWVSQCYWAHDQNLARADPAHFTVGQNLAWLSHDSPTKDWNWAVWYWHDEKQYFTHGTGCNNGEMCGHYTQVVDAKSYVIGCAFADCGDCGKFYGCDYGPAGNVGGFAHPYVVSDTQASGCPNTKVDYEGGSLCDCSATPPCALGEEMDPATCQCAVQYEDDGGAPPPCPQSEIDCNCCSADVECSFETGDAVFDCVFGEKQEVFLDKRRRRRK